jgi:type II secretory ATPase GspE/PulE/Tfp pilus assembly ATPase PilB-like protein
MIPPLPQIKKVSGEVAISTQQIQELTLNIKNIQDFKKAVKLSENKNISEIVEIVLGSAIALNASDLHLEPEENQAKLRARIDGVLYDIVFISRKLYSALLSRIKVLSKIKLNIFQKPQDGRFSINLGEKEIEIRTSTIPAEYGESVVMRLLNPQNLISLEELGLREDLLKIFEKEIKKPHGMIIITGPTGSGKTTTLYAFLMKIRNPEIKIITIEDPIEYHLEGISQTQVAPEKGYDFASGLRSIVRQDPDVILVGEIRDLETASIALQAALTGHLVLTTLHTNDAAGTVARLIALGEKPVNIAPALNMAVAQRLVRRVCKNCARFEKPTPQEKETLIENLKNLPKNLAASIDFDNLKIARVQGCDQCNFTGFKGRIAIFEAFLVDEEMEQFILTAPSISALRKKARDQGMVTMRQDGYLKVVAGITTIEEVEKIVGPTD